MNNENNKNNYDENNYESDENNKENNVLRRARSETRLPDAPSEQGSQAASAPLLSPACMKIREDLKASVDGQLGWWRQQTVTRHIAHCIACREEREAMREFSERLRQSEFEQAGSQQERFQQNLSQATSPGQKYGWDNFERGAVGNADVLDPVLRARILAAVPVAPPASPMMSSPQSRPRRLPLYLAGAAVSSALIAAALFPIFNSGSASFKSASSPTVVSDPAAETQPTATAITPPAGRAAGAVSKTASAKDVANGYAVPQAPSHRLVDNTVPNSAPGGAASLPGSSAIASASSAAVPSAKRSISSVSAPRIAAGKAKPQKVMVVQSDNANVSMVVGNVERCATVIEQIVRQEGGAIILSAFTTHSDKTESAKLTVKIPAAQRAALMSQVAHCAENKTRSGVAGKSAHSPEPAPASPLSEPPTDKTQELPNKQKTAKKKVTKESDLIAITIQLTGRTR